MYEIFIKKARLETNVVCVLLAPDINDCVTDFLLLISRKYF